MDFTILDFIQNHMRCDLLDFFFSNITRLGNAGIIWIILGIGLIFQKKHRITGIGMLLSMLAAFLINDQLIKPLVCRPRPFTFREITLLIPPPNGWSFPSGHSCSAFCAAVFLFYSDRKLGTPAFVLAGLIAFSRMYLYVHFPTDVLCGSLLGSLLGFLFFHLCTTVHSRASGNLRPPR